MSRFRRAYDSFIATAIGGAISPAHAGHCWSLSARETSSFKRTYLLNCSLLHRIAVSSCSQTSTTWESQMIRPHCRQLLWRH